MQRNGLFNQTHSVKQNFDDFIQWMNDVGRFEKIAEADIAMHFSKEFEYRTNDKVTATNAQQLANLIQNAKTKYRKAYIHFPISELEINGNEVKAIYQVTFIDINGVARDDTNTVHVVFDANGLANQFHQSYKIQPPMKTVEHEAKMAIMTSICK